MDGLRHDVRFALRSFRRSPAFSLVAVLTLATGIGVATATFTVANGIVFRPLPVREQDRVIVLWSKQRDFAHVPVRWADVDRFASESRVFEAVAGIDYNGAWTWAMSDRGEPAPIKGTWVTGDFFRVLGVVPQLGRVIERSDDVPNAPNVAVITDGLWRRRYGADTAVIGRPLAFEGKQFTIIGVAPRGFEYPQGVELWSAVVPFFPGAQSDTAPGSLDVFARLRPRATMEQGRREFDGFLDRAYARWRSQIGKFEATARTLQNAIVGSVEQRLLTLLGGAALVLIIACMNVANLLLVRAVIRTREVAIRASLGATRRRIVRQLMTESAMLAVAGTLVGVLVAAAMVRVLIALAPAEVPRLEEVTIDGRVVAFSCSAAILAVLGGLAPAFTLARGDIGVLVRQSGSRGAVGSRASTRSKQVLIVAQAALAVLVLGTAGLLARSLLNLQQLDLGFDRERLVIAQLTMPWRRFDTSDGSDRFTLLLDRLQEATRALPGVTSVGVAASPPYSGTGGWDALPTVDDQPDAVRKRLPRVNMEVVTSDYFATLGVPLVRGRLLSASDRKRTAPVAVVNETMARRYWPNESAIGRRFRLGARADTSAPRYTVVGIVGDMRYRELTNAMPSFYVPNAQYTSAAPTWFMLRTARLPETIVPALRRVFSAVDPDAALLSVRTMDDYLAGPMARPRFSSALGAVYALVALVLVSVGISAVIGEHVRHRRRELGIRLALGARSSDVRRSVFAAGLWPVALGIAIGTAVAFPSARVVASQLYGVKPSDPFTLAAAVVVVFVAAGLSCLAPVRHAARVDPVEILRAD